LVAVIFRFRSWIAPAVFAGITLLAQAQSLPPASLDAPATTEAKVDDRGVRLRSLPRDIFEDQQALFTAPFRMRERQWKLAVPLSVLAVGLVASDTAFENHVTKTPSTVSHASTFSNAGLATLAGVGGGMYLWGTFAKSEHQRETGFLSGEAAIDAYLDTTLIKSVAGRDRPFTANGRGNFFDGGSSFPSQHSAVSWAIASVIAHEYPGPLTKILSYGLAGAVSAARVEAHQHFLSDAVIGSAIGWYLGRQVYRARSSDADIDVRKWGTFERDEGSEQRRATSQMGSSYVPLDSWLYQAFDRLAALGYVQSGSLILRPWTRLECARALRQAHDASGEEDPIAAPLLDALDKEFAHETNLMDGGRNEGAQVESVYARFSGISGTPLRDSFHFAQTLVDDNGRPYGQGANGIAGFSSHAEAGPLAVYVRGEYQYASSVPAYNATAQQAIATEDALPLGYGTGFGTTNRLRPIEAYAALTISNWQLSVGQQSLWWGPDRSTALVMSNNAEAMPMVRLDQVSPVKFPVLGAMRSDFFLSRLGGVHFVRLGNPAFVLTGDVNHSLDQQPYMWGANMSFKPTENFEFGVGLTAIIAGLGRPLNLKTFLHSFSPSGNGQAVDPGKRATEFNFSYRVPGLRNWLTLYAEGLAWDEPLPLLYPRRSAMNPGVYLARIPGTRKLDLRVEGVYTNLPGLRNRGFFYSNAHYADGYRNYGQIIGSWIGRQGSGATATSTYWFSARNKLSASYRKMVADKSFLQGGNLDDFSGSVTWMLRPGIQFSAMSQYERWNFSLLAAGARSNVATSLEVRLFPSARFGAAKDRTGSGAGEEGRQP
jgi:Capsule assembly protein Wzi/PAP2 superfamily